jgi:hypothetical protein
MNLKISDSIDIRTYFVPKKQRYYGLMGPKDYYKYYCSQHGKEITFLVFRKILKEFNQFLSDKVVEGEEIITTIGRVRVQKCRTDGAKTKRLDYQLTKQLGRIIHHNNFHSEGWYARIAFLKNKYTTIGRHYRFIFTRTIKQRLANRIKNDPLYMNIIPFIPFPDRYEKATRINTKNNS